MKHTIKYLLLAILMLIPVLAPAQQTPPPIYGSYQIAGNLGTAKTLSGPEDGLYTITLETFATGLKTVINKAIPSDIVLVLDYSSSMLMPGSLSYPATRDQLNNCKDYLYRLKIAVGDFVKLLQENNETLPLDEGQTGNRIAFIIYADELYGPDQLDRSGGKGNFYARYMSQFIPVADLKTAETTETHPVTGVTHNSCKLIYNGIDILSPSSYRSAGNAGNNGISNRYDLGDVNKGTATGSALTEANRLVNTNTTNFPYTERSTTVVLFTDGEPSRIGHSGFYQNEAQIAVRHAYLIKTDNATETTGTPYTSDDVDSHVKFFTVGLLTNPSNQMRTFLEYVSSDFSLNPPAENPNPSNPYNMPTGGYLTGTDYGPYSSIVSQGADLSGVFSTIAESSGGSSATIPAETQLVDIISNSFEVPDPEHFDINRVTVYTRSINAAGTAWGTPSYLEKQLVETGTNPPMTVQQPDEGKIGIALHNGKLTVLGFDFSKADQEDEDGSNAHPYTGNWVGWRNNICAGSELVIQFQIEADPDATGGVSTNTNGAGSGVYVPIIDDATHKITGYTCLNQYEAPHTDLPINLEIKKTGLLHGESATVQIYRSRQQIVDGKIQYHPTTGKPLPEASQGDLDDPRWENFSKVILTNTGADNTDVTKTLLSLDPNYVYMLAEDAWGWSYNLDKKTYDTSEVERNPITFENTVKTDAVKHAEAYSINHFGTDVIETSTVTGKSQKLDPSTTNNP